MKYFVVVVLTRSHHHTQVEENHQHYIHTCPFLDLQSLDDFLKLTCRLFLFVVKKITKKRRSQSHARKRKRKEKDQSDE